MKSSQVCAALSLTLLLIANASAQELGRPIIPFDFAPVLSVLFRRLQQPIQLRTIYLYITSWYNSNVVLSETGSFINGSEPMFRRSELPDESQGVSISAVSISNTLHVFGEEEALLVQEHAAEVLFLDLPMRAEDVPDDHPARDDLLLGFQIAAELQEEFSRDGMNDDGRDDELRSVPVPFEDITGYVPFNTPGNIRDLRRWTPLIESPRPLSIGEFSIQQAITPQAAFVETPLLTDQFSRVQTVPSPYNEEIPRNATCDMNRRSSQTSMVREICRDTDEMISMQANITEEQKSIAEYFDDPVLSLDLNNIPLVLEFNISFRDAFTFVLLMNGGMYETTLLVWREKRRHDAVRPVTLVNELYRDMRIESGSEDEAVGQDFTSFIRTAPRQEYPSLHAAQCQYYADVATIVSGSSNVTIDVPFLQGSSSAEPGVLPSRDFTFEIRDLGRDIADLCSESRIWGGTNLRPAVERGREIGHNVALEYMNRLACLAPDNDVLPPCQQ